MQLRVKMALAVSCGAFLTTVSLAAADVPPVTPSVVLNSSGGEGPALRGSRVERLGGLAETARGLEAARDASDVRQPESAGGTDRPTPVDPTDAASAQRSKPDAIDVAAVAPPERPTRPAAPARPPEPAVIATIDLTSQRMTVAIAGTATHSWPISSGRAGYLTPTGTFRPQWMAKMWYSRQYDNAPMPYAVFFNRGIATHGTSAVGMLGRPASHGCIRLRTDNARTFYELVSRHGKANVRIIVKGTTPLPAPRVTGTTTRPQARRRTHGSPQAAPRVPAARAAQRARVYQGYVPRNVTMSQPRRLRFPGDPH